MLMRQYQRNDLEEIAAKITSLSVCEAESRDVLDALYWLDAVAQNEYNRDCFRVILNVLARI